MTSRSEMAWICTNEHGAIYPTLAETQTECVTLALALVDWSVPSMRPFAARRRRWQWMRANMGFRAVRVRLGLGREGCTGENAFPD